MAYTNLLPPFSSAEWVASGDSTMTRTSPTETTIILNNSSAYVRYRITTPPWPDVAYKIGFGEYTSDKKSRIRLRSEAIGGAYEYFLVVQNAGTTIVDQEDSGFFPSDLYEFTYYIQPDSPVSYPVTIVLKDPYIYDVTVVEGFAINFHKVTEANLPQSVTVGTEHIYFMLPDGSNFARMYVSKLNGGLIPVGTTGFDYINAYTQAHIDARLAEIRALQNSKHLSFIQITDIHIEDEIDSDRFNQLKDAVMVTKQLPIDFIAVTGDLISNPDDVGFDYGRSEKRLRMIFETLAQANCPVFYTRGNHDYNYSEAYWDLPGSDHDIITSNRDWYNWVGERMLDRERGLIYDSGYPMSAYFYVDDPVLKQRSIFLNDFEVLEDANDQPLVDGDGGQAFTVSGIYKANQVSWLLDKALNMTGKTDYTVAFFSHRIPYALLDGTDTEFHGYGSNNLPLRQIIQAFINGTSVSGLYYNYEVGSITKSFTAQGPIAVIGWFAGHIHDDCYIKLNDINLVVSVNTCASQRTEWDLDLSPVKLPPERNETDKAMSLNLFIVNRNTKVVDRIKLGVGEDHQFSY